MSVIRRFMFALKKEAIEKRTERVFNKFPNVIVSLSGEKDSRVTLAIAYKVATRRG